VPARVSDVDLDVNRKHHAGRQRWRRHVASRRFLDEVDGSINAALVEFSSRIAERSRAVPRCAVHVNTQRSVYVHVQAGSTLTHWHCPWPELSTAPRFDGGFRAVAIFGSQQHCGPSWPALARRLVGIHPPCDPRASLPSVHVRTGRRSAAPTPRAKLWPPSQIAAATARPQPRDHERNQPHERCRLSRGQIVSQRQRSQSNHSRNPCAQVRCLNGRMIAYHRAVPSVRGRRILVEDCPLSAWDSAPGRAMATTPRPRFAAPAGGPPGPGDSRSTGPSYITLCRAGLPGASGRRYGWCCAAELPYHCCATSTSMLECRRSF